jgi:hypothetical protein
MDVLQRIKRLVMRRRVRFTEKALDEMDADGLVPSQIYESLLNARAIAKVIRSRNFKHRSRPERLYVIKSLSDGGTPIYTKGGFQPEGEGEVFYVLISSKITTRSA